jgi:hypothetical protein
MGLKSRPRVWLALMSIAMPPTKHCQSNPHTRTHTPLQTRHLSHGFHTPTVCCVSNGTRGSSPHLDYPHTRMHHMNTLNLQAASSSHHGTARQTYRHSSEPPGNGTLNPSFGMQSRYDARTPPSWYFSRICSTCRSQYAAASPFARAYFCAGYR